MQREGPLSFTVPSCERHQAGCPSGQRERSVKPSASPSQVRILDLPPVKAAAQGRFGAPDSWLRQAAHRLCGKPGRSGKLTQAGAGTVATGLDEITTAGSVGAALKLPGCC